MQYLVILCTCLQVDSCSLLICNIMSTNIASPASDHHSSMFTTGRDYRHEGDLTLLSGQPQCQQLPLASCCRNQVQATSGHVNFAVETVKFSGSHKMLELQLPQQRGGTKRHYSFSADDKHTGPKQRRYSDRFGAGSAACNFRKRGGRGGRHHPGDRGEKIVLPTRFLLGGSITDPLNLNSLCDEAVNRSMNENTPVSSPLPVPVHKLEVPVRMPTNVADPLNLNAVDITEEQPASASPWSLFKKRRKRKRKHQPVKEQEKLAQIDEAQPVKPLHVETDSKVEERTSRQSRDLAESVTDPKSKRVIDHIVSPVIPQMSPKWKRRRTVSESRPDTGNEFRLEDLNKHTPERTTPVKQKKRNISQSQMNIKPARRLARSQKFCFGNFSRLVVNRNAMGYYEDPRLSCFSPAMFEGRSVLDIGCNVGHIALTIARDFNPDFVLGVDIDNHLITAAKKNLQHFVSSTISHHDGFPVAFKACLGPLAAPPLYVTSVTAPDKNMAGFPHNIQFLQVFRTSFWFLHSCSVH
jgi:2-polyprenyl-3-methyl-5-hydroxy-6-metoxy-1,4-benzoquinol methylase